MSSLLLDINSSKNTLFTVSTIFTWSYHKLAEKTWERRFFLLELHQNRGSTLIGPHRIFNQFSLAPIMVQRLHWLQRNWGQWELVKYSVQTNESASPILVQAWSSGFKDYKWKCPSQRLNIDWNEPKTISDVNLLIWEGYFTKRMRLRALLFDLCPFENSTGPWEGLLPLSQYLSIQPI